jgi:hypothetical protein
MKFISRISDMKLNDAWLHVLCEGVGELGQFTVRNKRDCSCVTVMCNY